MHGPAPKQDEITKVGRGFCTPFAPRSAFFVALVLLYDIMRQGAA